MNEPYWGNTFEAITFLQYDIFAVVIVWLRISIAEEVRMNNNEEDEEKERNGSWGTVHDHDKLQS